MKKTSSAARCTGRKGSECRIEIREPLGSGRLKYLGIEAIRQNPPLRNKGALNRIIPQAQIQPELCASYEQFQSTVALGVGSSATKYRLHESWMYESTVGLRKTENLLDDLGG